MDYGSTAGMARFIEDKNEIDYIFSKYVLNNPENAFQTMTSL